jgi:hypothetical protein
VKLALDVWYELWERGGDQGSEGWDEMKGLDEGDKRGLIQTRLRSSAEDTVEEAGSQDRSS